ETRIAGDRKAPAPTPEPAVDASVLVRPGSRRAQPIAAPAIEEKPSRFSLKLPFLKAKPKDAPPAADEVQDVAGGRSKPAKPGQEPSSRAAAAGTAMPGGDFDTADMATAALTAPAPALHASALGHADMPLEPGSGRPGSQMDMSARLVAAARRAAQGAAEETASAKGKAAATAKAEGTAGGSIQSMLAARKRPILIGLGGLAMAAMLINIASSMLNPPPVVAVDHRPKAVEKLPAATPQLPTPRAAAPALPAMDKGMTSEPAPQVTPVPTGEPDRQSAIPNEPATVGAINGGKPLDIAPGGSLLNPAPLNPPAPAATPAAQQVAALAPAELPQGLTSTGLKAAVARGDIGALYEVGTRLMDGKGVARDSKQAFTWFERAANAGLAPAQFRVGNMYEKGIGVTRDLRQARFWYGKAADKGNAKAIHNLGVIIAEGGDGKPDYNVASDLFRRAAQFGIRDSQYNIAILLARGLGVGQSMKDAYMWF
ncbi:MAG: tetratricopeptide repeat protein, partial [Beijerinckiaceae bacterium]